jgi:endonuclease YncB( thermonuclease family)
MPADCTKTTVLLLLFAFAPAAFAATYTGKVIGISDGDTIKILVDRTQRKIRLAEIDTPEKGQPYGKKAKQALSRLVFGKTVTVEKKDIDRYGRIVGRVYVDGVDVNAEMVRGGHAWVYRKYATDQTFYAMEGDAKRNRRGLWALPEAQRVPPWEWRHGSRSASRTVRRQAVGGSFTCGSKRYCKQMTSCAEARFYMDQCGLGRLDGDRDGVPCERICR